MSDDTWTVAVHFQTEDAETAQRLRTLVEDIAGNFHGVHDVTVDAEHPEHFAWVNLTGNPGDGHLLDLRTVDSPRPCRACGMPSADCDARYEATEYTTGELCCRACTVGDTSELHDPTATGPICRHCGLSVHQDPAGLWVWLDDDESGACTENPTSIDHETREESER